jgi:hypothetical protein
LTFLGEAYDNGTGVNALPPLGWAPGSGVTQYSTCDSTVSQPDADACAQTAASLGTSGTWVPPQNQPNPRPPVQTFKNTPQSATTHCNDGSPFTFTTPAGMFTASTQAAANQDAFSYAEQQAQHHLLCLSPIQSPICANQGANLTIFASSAFITPSGNIWQFISGTLPPGMAFNPSGGAQAFITGTPTATGTYSFVVEVILPNGDSQSKTYSLTVAGITNLNSLPNAQTLQPYNATLLVLGFSLPEFFLTGGQLPDGLTMDVDGNITGTPAADAQTSTFNVTISDFNTGLTCDQSVTITVGGTLNFNQLVWQQNNIPPFVANPSGTFQNNNFQFASGSFGNTLSNSASLTFSGPSTNCNLQLVVTGNTGAMLGTLTVTDQLSNTYLTVANANIPATGTFNFPFTIPSSSGRVLTFSFNTVGCGYGGLTYNMNGTITPAM